MKTCFDILNLFFKMFPFLYLLFFHVAVSLVDVYYKIFSSIFFLCWMIFETIPIEHFLFKLIYFRSVLRSRALCV